GKTLISTAMFESSLRLWDVATGKEIRQFAGHHTPVDQLAFSADGKALFSRGRYQGILRWDLATGQEQRWFDSDGPCEPSPDGKIVATCARSEGPVRLWDAATGKQLHLLAKHGWTGLSGRTEAPRRPLAFSPDGKLLATADENPAVRLWDVASGKEVREFRGL